MNIRYFILTFFLAILGLEAFAQDRVIDSLEKIAINAKDDTTKAETYNVISTLYLRSDPNKGIEYALKAVAICEKLEWKTGLYKTYNSLASNYAAIANYSLALENYLKSLKICEEINDKEGIAGNATNIGSVYLRTADYDKALEYFNRALKENEAIGRKIGMANNYSQIARVFSEMEQNEKALDYLKRALAISEEIGDREGVAIFLGNIAIVYDTDSNYKEAIEYYEKSIKVNQELERIVGVAINYNNLAKIYLGYATDSTGSYKNAGIRLTKDASMDTAINYFQNALPVFIRISALDMMSEVHENLAILYSVKKDYKKAFEHFTTFKQLQDSIFSNDEKVKMAELGEERAELEKRQQVKLTQLTQTKRRNEAILFAVGITLLPMFVVSAVRARRRSDKLLLNILPQEVAEELKQKGSADAKYFNEVTVLFTDFVDFTVLTEKLSPQGLVDELDVCFKAFDGITSKYRIEKIKTVGDAYLAVSGLPAADKQHALNVAKAAVEILDFMTQRRAKLGDKTFEVRIGVHSGSVVAGIVGVKKFAYDIWGDTVNIAARMEQSSEPGKINISEATHELIKDKFTCTYRGEIEVKNKGGLAMYFIDAPKS